MGKVRVFIAGLANGRSWEWCNVTPAGTQSATECCITTSAERSGVQTFGVLTMNWKSILFIGAIAIGAVYVFNKFVGPRIGVSA